MLRIHPRGAFPCRLVQPLQERSLGPWRSYLPLSVTIEGGLEAALAEGTLAKVCAQIAPAAQQRGLALAVGALTQLALSGCLSQLGQPASETNGCAGLVLFWSLASRRGQDDWNPAQWRQSSRAAGNDPAGSALVAA